MARKSHIVSPNSMKSGSAILCTEGEEPEMSTDQHHREPRATQERQKMDVNHHGTEMGHHKKIGKTK